MAEILWFHGYNLNTDIYELYKFDGATGDLIGTLASPFPSPSVNPSLAFGDGALWVSIFETVKKIDPSSGAELLSFDIPFSDDAGYTPEARHMGVDLSGMFWFSWGKEVWRLNPNTVTYNGYFAVSDSTGGDTSSMGFDPSNSNRVYLTSFVIGLSYGRYSISDIENHPGTDIFDPAVPEVQTTFTVSVQHGEGGSSTSAGEHLSEGIQVTSDGTMWCKDVNVSNIFKISPLDNNSPSVLMEIPFPSHIDNTGYMALQVVADPVSTTGSSEIMQASSIQGKPTRIPGPNTYW